MIWWPSHAHDPGTDVIRNLYVLLAGALSALGLAPLELWPLTLVALMLLMHWLAQSGSLRRACGTGFVFGLGHFALGMCWLPTAFTYQANMPAWLGWLGEVLLAAYLALYPAFACGLAWRLTRGSGIGFVFLLAATWMLAEWLRGTLLSGCAWNPLGVIWIGVPAVSRAASWIGAYGLSSVAILVAGLLWLGLRRRSLPVATWVSAVLVFVSGVLVWLGSVRGPEEAARDPAGIAVRVVQPDIGQAEKYDEEARNARLYATLSGQPGPVPRVLLWPEGATLKLLEIEPQARAALGALLGPHDLLLIGGESITEGAKPSDDVYHNSVFAVDHSGTLLWRYDKEHLVPFGEYLPARAILSRIGISRLVPGESDFLRGPGPRTFTLPGFSSGGKPVTVGVQICYEIVFPGHVIDESHRPSFLFNPSNDAWFGAWGPPQHLAQAQLRAIEEGVPIIRATPNGISALIGAHGELIATVARHRAGVIDGVLPAPLPPTVFARFGLWSCALFGLLLGAVGLTAPRWAPGWKLQPLL
jgi:apolipoprotein N-acyltransferase